MSDTSDNSLLESNIPNLQQALAGLTSPVDAQAKFEQRFHTKFNTEAIKSETEYAHLKGIRDHYRHKNCWSYFVMMLMTFMVIFQIILLSMVGTNIWDYRDYEWLLPALLIQYFAQIAGLALFVVKSLFKNPQ